MSYNQSPLRAAQAINALLRGAVPKPPHEQVRQAQLAADIVREAIVTIEGVYTAQLCRHLLHQLHDQLTAQAAYQTTAANVLLADEE